MILPLDLALSDPLRQLRQSLRELLSVITNDKPFHQQALHQHPAEIPWTRHHAFIVIAGNHAAQRHAPIEIKPIVDGIHDLATYIFKLNIHAIRTEPIQGSRHVIVALLDGAIKTQDFSQPATLFRTTGNSYNPTALKLANLPNDRTDRARCGRYDQGLARLRISDIQ